MTGEQKPGQGAFDEKVRNWALMGLYLVEGRTTTDGDSGISIEWAFGDEAALLADAEGWALEDAVEDYDRIFAETVSPSAVARIKELEADLDQYHSAARDHNDIWWKTVIGETHQPSGEGISVKHLHPLTVKPFYDQHKGTAIADIIAGLIFEASITRNRERFLVEHAIDRATAAEAKLARAVTVIGKLVSEVESFDRAPDNARIWIGGWSTYSGVRDPSLVHVGEVRQTLAALAPAQQGEAKCSDFNPDLRQSGEGYCMNCGRHQSDHAHPPAQASETGGALASIAAERRRQVEVEGWTPEHDDGHKPQDMALAAACYAAGSTFKRYLSPEERREQRTHEKYSKGIWPWEKRWWKSTDRRRDLVKAGALIVAEIERLDRAALSAPQAAPELFAENAKNSDPDPRVTEWGYSSTDEALTHLGKLLEDQAAFDGLAASGEGERS